MLKNRFSVLLGLVVVFSACGYFLYMPAGKPTVASAKQIYPQLLAQAKQVEKIVMQQNDQKLTLRKLEKENWVLENKDNYPIQAKKVGTIVEGLGNLTVVEPKTQNPELYEKLHLQDIDQEKSKAMLIQLLAKDDKPLAKLLVGKIDSYAGLQDKDQIYVRKPGEQQTFLVEGKLPESLQIKEWIKQPMLPIKSADIKSIEIKQAKKTQLKVAKPKKEDNEYKIANLKKGAEIESQFNVDNIAYTLSNLTIEDVQPVAKLAKTTWSKALVAELQTFSGLKIELKLLKLKDKALARVMNVKPIKGKNVTDKDIAEVLKEFGSNSSDWAFSFSADQYESIDKKPSDFVKS